MIIMNNYCFFMVEEKFIMFFIDRLSKWLEFKVYQFEVMMSVYMFMLMEKFIFCMFGYMYFFFLLGGLLIEGK